MSLGACRVAVLQPALPHYRRVFFDELGAQCASLTVLHGAGKSAAYHEATTGRFLQHVVTHRVMGPVWWMPAIWTVADPTKYDVILYSWNVHYPHLLPGILRARRRSIGTVLWGHGYSKNERWWRQFARTQMARSAHVVITYGRAAARILMEQGIAPDRVVVGSNALDQSAIQAAREHWLGDGERLAAFQLKEGLAGRPVAIYVSRLTAVEDFGALFQAWRSVARAMPEARLVIVGGGPALDAVQSRCRRLGIGDSVRFMGAIYDEWSLAPFFLTARVLAYPCRIGLSIHHAFGYGLPVLTFNTPMAHGPEFEVLRDGVNGLLAKDGNVDDFAEKLTSILSDPERARSLGVAARAFVLEHCTVGRMVSNFKIAIARAWGMAKG